MQSKKLDASWNGVSDPTGYLFSFSKALSCAMRMSPYAELAEDIVASSGFAFRMWSDAVLCPSAMSMWEFSKQAEWLRNGGVEASCTTSLWQPDEKRGAARNVALQQIRDSIDRGIPAIAWDIVVNEWGLVTGYDDSLQKLTVLPVTNNVASEMDYGALGNRDMPMLNVVTITGTNGRSQDEIVRGTLRLAAAHLLGKEWRGEGYQAGLDVYPVLAGCFEEENPERAQSEQMAYFLGTIASGKLYAWKYLAKHGFTRLAELYKEIYGCWLDAFHARKSSEPSAAAALLRKAEACEREAACLMDASCREDMNPERLAVLFPIILREHDPAWEDAYRSEAEFLRSVFGDALVKISHIGSTAVPGLIAKPTIDILLEIEPESGLAEATDKLLAAGYVINRPPSDLIMFIKGYTPRGFEGQTYHVHVRYAGDWGEPYFRDYLIAHPDTAAEYA